MTIRRGKDKGKTIFFTSHHLREVEALAETVLLMEAGRIKNRCAGSVLAQTIGARCLLKVFVGDGMLDDAVGVLRDGGYVTSRNGEALRVEVPPGEKAAPLQLLSRADIEVRNFELTGAAGGELAHGGIGDE